MKLVSLLETDEGEVLVHGVQLPQQNIQAGWTSWVAKLALYTVLIALTMLAILDVFAPFSSVAVIALVPVFVFGVPKRTKSETLVWYELDFKQNTIWEVRA